MNSRLLQRQIRLNASVIADYESAIDMYKRHIKILPKSMKQSRDYFYKEISSLRKKLKKIVELQIELKLDLKLAYEDEYFDELYTELHLFRAKP